MKPPSGTLEIPISVLESIDTLDELEDWLSANNPRVMQELREARLDDLEGRVKRWEPRHVAWPTPSK
jgi:hypothetical protein